MRVLLLVSCCLFGTLAAKVTDKEWLDYRLKYGKFYTPDQDIDRKKAYEASKNVIDDINAKKESGELSFTCNPNKYADEPREETSQNLLGLRLPNSKSRAEFMRQIDPAKSEMRGSKPPPYFNWAERNKTNPIQDQSSCGSCYAFATVGVIEAHYAIKTNTLHKLSEQQVVDCTEEYGNYGCDGGLMTAAYDYFIEEKKGSMPAADYEYMAFQQSQCYYEKQQALVRLQRYRALPPENEDLMIHALANVGPLAAAMDASQPSFLFYSGGIYDDPKCNSSSDAMNHAVMIVGYGSKDGKDYWIIRNTWSTDWGVNGFGYILRNDENFCGLANLVSYPIVKVPKLKNPPRRKP